MDNETAARERNSEALYVQIANIWRERIASGEFKPGDTLPSERDIAAAMNVSRIPVREAMKSLEYLGCVRQVRGKGVVVQRADLSGVLRVAGPLAAPGSPATVVDLFGVRLALEPWAARLAAEQASGDELAAVAALVEGPGAADSEASSNAFHRAVCKASHNSVLAAVGDFLAELQRQSVHVTAALPGRTTDSREWHARIAAALARRDAAAAERLMREHLEEALRLLRQAARPR
ncbi:MAG: FadR family transcriptional regulator [Duodenibacillus sp.]|nr:FadR family transcriptional regulator [Duodenibacillus sp.]